MKEGLNNTANTNGGTDRQTLTLLSANGDQHQFLLTISIICQETRL